MLARTLPTTPRAGSPTGAISSRRRASRARPSASARALGKERRLSWVKNAAIVVAAILQRGAAISSAGGYLREFTRKAQANEFSIGAMLMALIGARNREKKCA